MLTKTVPTTKQVPVKVLSLKWFNGLKKGSELSKLPCTACRKAIGHDNWAIAWQHNEGKKPSSMRLCLSCGKKAEQALIEE